MLTYTPKSLDDRTYWKRAADVVAKDETIAKLQTAAQKLPPRPALPAASDFLAAKRLNDRARVDNVWQRTRSDLAQLTLNRCILGLDPNDLDDRLLDWIFDFLYMSSWTVSAHLPGMDLPLSGEGQLDLAGTEMSMKMAETRELLLPWIKSVTGTLDQSIVNEIDRRVLTPFADGANVWWGPHGREMTNNWSGVCGGSILAACLSLAAQGFERPKARDRAIETLAWFLERGFTKSGECDEGIAYWNYGVEFACLGLMRLDEKTFNDRIDLNRIKAVAAFPGRAHLIGQTFFAGNDTVRTAGAPAPVTWLALTTDDPFLTWWCAKHRSGNLRDLATLMRAIVFSLDDRFKLPEPGDEPTHPPARMMEDQQVAIFQTKTPAGLVSFTITGGNNGENHNHNDLGTFQFFVNERALIPDLGSPQYKSDFFGAERYTKYIVAASSGHCCPQINGQEQREGAIAAAKVIAYDEKLRSFELDLTPAYPPEAGLKQWRRKAVMSEDAGVLITDHFEVAGEIVHRIWLEEQPKVNADGIVETDTLHLSLTPKPTKIEALLFKAGDPRLLLREYKPDVTLYRIDATYTPTTEKAVTIETMLRLR